MLTIQDTELMQLIHEQQSINWLKQRNQLPVLEQALKSYFILPVTFSIIAIALGPVI